jgi:hypothetical protein
MICRLGLYSGCWTLLLDSSRFLLLDDFCETTILCFMFHSNSVRKVMVCFPVTFITIAPDT